MMADFKLEVMKMILSEAETERDKAAFARMDIQSALRGHVENEVDQMLELVEKKEREEKKKANRSSGSSARKRKKRKKI